MASTSNVLELSLAALSAVNLPSNDSHSSSLMAVVMSFTSASPLGVPPPELPAAAAPEPDAPPLPEAPLGGAGSLRQPASSAATAREPERTQSISPAFGISYARPARRRLSPMAARPSKPSAASEWDLPSREAVRQPQPPESPAVPPLFAPVGLLALPALA